MDEWARDTGRSPRVDLSSVYGSQDEPRAHNFGIRVALGALIVDLRGTSHNYTLLSTKVLWWSPKSNPFGTLHKGERNHMSKCIVVLQGYCSGPLAIATRKARTSVSAETHPTAHLLRNRLQCVIAGKQRQTECRRGAARASTAQHAGSGRSVMSVGNTGDTHRVPPGHHWGKLRHCQGTE